MPKSVGTSPSRGVDAVAVEPRHVEEHAVREYIASLSRQLAGMARSHGDEQLGVALDLAAALADRPALS